MAFGVVLFTILAQGVSMDWVLKKLKIIFRSESQLEYERRHARALVARAGFEHLSELHEEGLLSAHTWEGLQSVIRGRSQALSAAVQDALHETPELEHEELITARREELSAQRGALGALRRDGVISDEIYEELVTEIDIALDAGLEVWAERVLADHVVPNIRQLILVMVQTRDIEPVANSLAIQGVPATLIQSRGGFLKKPNQVLLVGVPEGKLDQVVKTLRRSTESRTEQVDLAEAGLPLTGGDSRAVRIHGATVFVFDIERYEEI
jgi:uncharacterized protein YaaQ